MVNTLSWPSLAAGAIDADTTLYGVKDPSGTPLDRNFTVAALAGSSPFAGLYATIASLGSYATSAAVAAALANYQALSGKGVASGYAGLDTAAAIFQSIVPPERRVAYEQRQFTAFMARVTTEDIREQIITDSFGHTGASAPETTSWPALYEIAMARKYNRRGRLGGYVPVELWTSGGGTDVPGIAWDSVPAGQHNSRGTNLGNKRILATQSATVARRGTGVTIFYTAAGNAAATPGAVVNVTIDGASGGTIDSRDAGLGSAYDSGRSVYIPLPIANQPALCSITLTHSGTGTSFEVEGAYFHGDNQDNGHQVLRCDSSGLSIQAMAGATGAPIVQVVGNYQPHIVTIMLGCNDGQLGRSPAQMAADLATLVGLIRAEYATWTPAIRYMFQWNWATGTQPAGWTMTYRAAMRAQCTTSDVLFVDARDATGDLNGGDVLDLSDDSLHPNDPGNAAIAQALLQVSTRSENTRLTPYDLGTFRPQLANNNGTTLYSTGAQGHILKLALDANAAVGNGALLGAIAFGGAQDAYGTIGLTAALRGISDEAFTGSTQATRVELLNTPTGGGLLTVRQIWDSDGAIYFGASNGTATSKFVAGEAQHVGGLVTGTLIGTARISDRDLYHHGAGAASFTTYKSGGTAAAPTVASASAELYRHDMRGYDGVSAYQIGASIVALVAGANFSATNAASLLTFYVSPVASVTPASRLVLYGTPAQVQVDGQLQVSPAGTHATPASANSGLDLITGNRQVRRSTITLGTTAGLNSNIAMPTTGFAVITNSTGAFSIGGFLTPTPRVDCDGMEIEVHVTGTANTAWNTFTIVNEDASTTNAANRINTGVGVGAAGNIAGVRSALFRYDATLGKWLVVNTRL